LSALIDTAVAFGTAGPDSTFGDGFLDDPADFSVAATLAVLADGCETTHTVEGSRWKVSAARFGSRDLASPRP
jgi:hypothetical protein